MGVRETSIEQIIGIVAALAEPETDRYAKWQPEPPPDPDFLRRVRRLRWEKAGIVVALAAAWVVVFATFFFLHIGGAFGALGTFLGGGTVGIWMRVRSWRATPEVADLLDLPATCPQFPVELQYKVNGILYGRDEGIASFAGGWLHFQGRRTSWSLSKRTAFVTYSSASQINTNSSGSMMFKNIVWTTGRRSFGITVLPMDRVEGLERGLRSGFERELNLWSSKNEKPAGSAILPPAEPTPGLIDRLERSRRAAKEIKRGLALLLGASLVGFALTAWDVFWLLPGLGLTLGFFVALFVESSYSLRLAGLTIQCLNVKRSTPPRPPSLRSIARRTFKERCLNLQTRKELAQLEAIRPIESPDAVPVAVRYEIWSTVYRRELGWLQVQSGELRFFGPQGAWTVSSSDAPHRDPERASWRAHFEQPLSFEQRLDIPSHSGTILARILPLELPGERGSADHLASLFAKYDSVSVPPSSVPVWPLAATSTLQIQSLERQFYRWSLVRLVAFPGFFGGIALAVTLALTQSVELMPVLAVCAAGIGALVMTIVAEDRREKAAKNLDAIRLYFKDGRSLVRFRRGQGPWWLRIGKPGSEEAWRGLT